MSENIIMVKEPRSFVEAAKTKMNDLINSYKNYEMDDEKLIKLEKTIKNRGVITKSVIGLAGSIATIVLTIVPYDGPAGELVVGLGTAGLNILTDFSTSIKKKILIASDNAAQNYLLKVDTNNEVPKISSYNFENGEIIDDFGQHIKENNTLGRNI